MDVWHPRKSSMLLGIVISSQPSENCGYMGILPRRATFHAKWENKIKVAQMKRELKRFENKLLRGR